MADNPLFYRNIVPLNREAHRGLKLSTDLHRFGFAARTNVIPAVVDEFGAGSRHLPIVFSPGPQQPTPVFLLGLRPDENVFVDANGKWSGDYVPAFVRRYPFILGDVADADPLMCFDDTYEAPSEGGEPVFLESGEDSPALKNVIQFANEYRNAANRTDVFIRALQGLELFRNVTIDARLPGQESRTVHGLMVIDLEKLNGLPDDKFLTLRRDGHLQHIYAHANSLTGVDKLGAMSQQAAS